VTVRWSRKELKADSWELEANPGRDELRTVACKPAVIRSQEKKWHVIPEQFAAFAVVKALSFF
jgi:hypothetical protein